MSFLDVDIEIDEFFLKNIKRVLLLYFCTENVKKKSFPFQTDYCLINGLESMSLPDRNIYR